MATCCTMPVSPFCWNFPISPRLAPYRWSLCSISPLLFLFLSLDWIPFEFFCFFFPFGSRSIIPFGPNCHSFLVCRFFLFFSLGAACCHLSTSSSLSDSLRRLAYTNSETLSASSQRSLYHQCNVPLGISSMRSFGFRSNLLIVDPL